MKLARRLILVVAFLAAGWWLWSVFFPSPQKAIRRHLEKTARLASFRATEGAMERLGNIAEFAKCFSQDVEVRFETPGGSSQSLAGRDDILRAAGLARNYGNALQVEFLDSILSVAPDRQTATVDLTVRARVPGDHEFFVQEMKLHLKKIGRAWLIIRAETVKTLSVNATTVIL
jgi:hypothetical protein